jgi:hypothetical protein
MGFARTIIAIVVALSVAMLPVAATMAASAKTAEIAASADASAAMDECCPDDAKQCDQGGSRCESRACCAYQTPSIANVAISRFAYPSVSDSPLPALAEHAVISHAGSPPFRPPRV